MSPECFEWWWWPSAFPHQRKSAKENKTKSKKRKAFFTFLLITIRIWLCLAVKKFLQQTPKQYLSKVQILQTKYVIKWLQHMVSNSQTMYVLLISRTNLQGAGQYVTPKYEILIKGYYLYIFLNTILSML